MTTIRRILALPFAIMAGALIVLAWALAAIVDFIVGEP